jgi:Mg2+/Co2+ transporter CorB
MLWLWIVVGVLVACGSVLAMAEASISRMSRIRAITLREAARRNAALLERIEEDPARHLNAVYLCVMFVQNGSAILVAILAEQAFGEVWVSVLSFAFTLAYFVVVEAMSKTLGILHSVKGSITRSAFTPPTGTHGSVRPGRLAVERRRLNPCGRCSVGPMAP